MPHPKTKLSVIEKGLTIDGSVLCPGQLIVDGTVKGSLVGHHIFITERGRVEAETRASFITIGGVFRGRLTVSGKLVLLSTGTCSGNIVCREMELETGGILNGDICCELAGEID